MFGLREKGTASDKEEEKNMDKGNMFSLMSSALVRLHMH